ncbi:lysozyme [Luteolibacter luteus]|uniref:Lysozyme n=1 Tax=Luteolibacter luteus TaxID=2728835 RepID=A0A858RDI0_9BACT|nr:lysozyme [Luteolibacter luteus]QJE94233.1 lysozyme [Luteolibacter luteus]
MSIGSFLRNLSAPFRGLFFNLIDHDPYSKKPEPESAPPQRKQREVNARGIELIKHFEGCYLSAYRDSVGVWTIGYGHTGLVHRDGTVKAGRTITQKEAEELLRHDLQVFAKRVTEGTSVPLSDDQFAALVSFDFNTGGFLKSTLRKKLNARDYMAAAEQLLLWDKAGGKRLRGLTRRRRSERRLFLGEDDFIERES